MASSSDAAGIEELLESLLADQPPASRAARLLEVLASPASRSEAALSAVKLL